MRQTIQQTIISANLLVLCIILTRMPTQYRVPRVIYELRQTLDLFSADRSSRRQIPENISSLRESSANEHKELVKARARVIREGEAKS